MKKANKFLVILTFLFFMTGCSSLEKKNLSPQEVALSRIEEDKNVLFGKDDHLSGFNNRVYKLNTSIDRHILGPVVKTYDYYTPEFLQSGIKNFFGNLGNVNTFANLLLQFRIKESFQTLSRFVVNSTAGVFGLFDVATDAGIPKYRESFSETMAFYHIGAGFPIVLPFFGPTNVRTAIGTGINGYASYFVEPYEFANINTSELPYTVVSALQLKKNLGIYFGETDFVFEYEYLKYLNKKYQELKLKQAKRK